MQSTLEQQQQRTSEFLAQRHRLMAYLIGLLGDAHAAEDIFQEIWMRLAAHQADDIQNTNAWCRAVGKNLVLHHWREKGRQKISVDSELLERIDQAFDEDDDRDRGHRNRKDALGECVKDLPDHSQSLLDQKYTQGLSFAELSKSTGKSENALMMTLSRIRKKLQECIERRLQQEGLAL